MSLHNPISPLHAYYVQKVLPAVYDDSLSYYEILCKVQETLNEVVSTTNEQSVVVLEMQQAIYDFIHGGYTDTFEEYLDEWFEENSDEFVQRLIDEGIIPEVADIQNDLVTVHEDISELVASDTSIRNDMVAADTSIRNDMNVADTALTTKKVPYPLVGTTPSYGTSGQVLSTNADGTTEWHDPVVPSDAQAQQVITQWLNAHPEATTTVQDGAITTAKLANGAVTDDKLAQSNGVLSAVSHIESQFPDINGVILPPSFEIGVRYVDENNNEVWSNTVKRMTFKRGTYISLKAGDTVTRDGSIIEAFGGGYSTDNGATFISINSQASYIAPSDGIYFFWLRKIDEANITNSDLENGWKYLTFYQSGNMGESITNLGYNVSMSAHDFYLFEQGKQTFYGFGNFEHYGLDVNGNFLLTQKYRVSNDNRMTFDRDLTVDVASGFRAGYIAFVDDTPTWRNWNTAQFKIPKGTIFNLQIARVSEDTSEIADVAEFVNAVTFVTHYEEENAKTETEISSVENVLNGTPLEITWEQGVVTVNGESSSTTRIRTKYIPVRCYENVFITRTPPYAYYYISYDKDYNVVEYIGTTTSSTTINITGTDIAYIRVVASTTNNSTIAPSEGENITITGKNTLTRINTINDRLTIVENVFRFNRYFSHIGVSKSSNIIIPSQSLADVSKTKRLGFKALEVNVHKTSDNDYVCLHGSSGKFGSQFIGADGTNVSDTSISSVTMDWIKTNVRYVSNYDKYKTAPPSLGEMLLECKAQNIIPLVQYVDATEVALLNKIMGQNNYILNIYGDNRNGISDAALMSWTSIASTSEAVAKCEASGKTYYLGVNVGASAFSSFTDSDWKTYIEAIHDAGYFVCGAYMNEATKQKMFSLGWDVLASDYPINEIDNGNLCNLFADVSFNDFITNGTVSNGSLYLSNGNTITPNANLPSVFLGGGSLHIKFDGIISVSFGGVSGTFTSDGTKDVWFSSFFEEHVPTFTITATNATTVYDIIYKASKL